MPRSFTLLAPLIVASCASAPPPESPPPPPPQAHAPRLAMSAELGSIDEGATKQTFSRLEPSLFGCFTKGLETIEFLSGDVKFYLRVKADGRLRWAFLEQSSLGDRTTEACMLNVLEAATWPQPDGGEAEVHHGMGFDAPQGVRPPTEWKPEKVAAALAKRSTDVSSCKKHGDGPFGVTAYVKSDHGTGHVLAAGFSAPTTAAAADIDCLSSVVMSMKLPTPGSYPAKVSFTL